MTEYQNVLLRNYYMAIGRQEAYARCEKLLKEEDNGFFLIYCSTCKDLAEFSEHEAKFAKERLAAEGITPI